MKAIPAIFDQGRMCFPFQYPEYDGPVSVLVIFPDPDDETQIVNQHKLEVEQSKKQPVPF